LGTFFASKSQGGATPLPESVRGWRMSPRHPLYPPLGWIYFYQTGRFAWFNNILFWIL